MAFFSFDSWLKKMRSSLHGTRRNKPRSAVRTIRSTRLNLEQLEDRVTPSSDYANLVLSNNPLAYWQFNEGSGTTAINSGSLGTGYNGTLNGSPTYSTNVPSPQLGDSLSFSAGQDVSAPLVTTSSGPVTMTAWVYQTSNSGTQVIFYNGNTSTSGYGLLAASGTLDFLAGGVALTSSGYTIPLNTWTFVALEVNGASDRVYVNGVQQLASNVSAHAPNTGTFIGSNNSNGQNFIGQIDEPALFSSQLSQTTLSTMYSAGLDTNPPAITTASLPNGTIGIPYSQTVATSGGTGALTFTFSSGSLPPGLALNSTTGVISGTPTSLGTFNFTVSAADTDGDPAAQAYAVTINTPTYGVSLDSGVLSISQANPGNDNLNFSLSEGSYTFTDAGGLTFGTPTGSGASLVGGGGTSTITITPSTDVSSISVSLGTGTNVFNLTGTGGASAAPITVNTGTTAGDQVNITGAVLDSGAISLTSNAISESGSGALSTTGTLTTSSATGTTLTDANTVSTFNATNSTSGNISLTNTATTLTVAGISESGSGSVTVSNTGALTVTGAVSFAGNLNLTAAGADKPISVQSALTKSSGGNATADLAATGDVRFENSGSLNVTSGALALTLNPDTDGNGAGGVLIHDSVLGTNGGSVTIGGGATPGTTPTGALIAGVGGVAGTGSAVGYGVEIDTGSAINAGAGNVSILAQAASNTSSFAVGIALDGGSVTTTTGSITMVGTGGNNAHNLDSGVQIGGSVQSTAGGSISLTGTGAGTGTGNRGVNISGTVSTTGAGTITLTGTGSATGASTTNYGVDIHSSGTVTINGSGAITINATAGAGSTAFDTTSGANRVGFNGTNTYSGNIAINANSLSLANDNITTTAAVTFLPTTASYLINVGAAGDLTTTLGLTSAELGTVSAGTINIGNASSGAITVSAAIALGSTNLALTTGAGIADSGSGSLTTTGSLTLVGSTIGTIGQALQLSATRLTPDTSANNGNQFLSTPATVTVTSLNAGTGTINLQGGTFKLGAANAISSNSAVAPANVAGATLNLNNFNDTIFSLSGGGTNGGNVALGSATLTTGDTSATSTYGGVISGTGSLVKQGSGTFTLTGANTYTGTTTINGGTLNFNSGGSFFTYTGGNLFINNGSTLAVSGSRYDFDSESFTFDSNGGGTINASASGLGGLQLVGMTTFQTNGGAQDTISGSGSAQFNTGAGGGVITFNVAAGTNPIADLNVSGNFFNKGSFVKSGAGKMLLTSANTYTGTTTINGGTLQLGAANAISSSSAVALANVAGATLNLNNFNDTIFSLAGGGTTGGNVALGSATLTTGDTSATTTYSGVISGTGGALTKVGTGTFTLAGANTFTGATTISAGTLEVDGSLASGSTVTVQSGGTLDGTGTVNGSVTVQSGGSVSPGDAPGILNTGNVTFNGGSNLDIALNGTTVGTQYAQLNSTGTVSLGNASLDVTLGFTSAYGTVFTLVSATSGSGTFNGLANNSTFVVNGRSLMVNYTATTVTLTDVTSPAVTAPANQTATEGSAQSFNLGSFSEPSGGPWTVTVSWGDNSSKTTFTATSAGSLGTQSHTYAEEGTYTVTVTVTDSSNVAGSASFQTTVADALLTAGTVSASGGVEGVTLTTLTATFTDANVNAPASDFSGTIDWGDGNAATPFTSADVTANGNGSFTINASYQYAEESGATPYNITVTINDVGGSSTSDTGTTTVADAPLTPGTVSASGGVEFTTPTSLTATFTDANLNAPTSDFSGTINWGDDNPATSFTAANVTANGGGSYTVSASYQYAEESGATPYNITVTINDVGTSTTTDTGTTAVLAAPTLSSTPSATSVTLGTTAPTLMDRASLANGYNATGTITFTLYFEASGSNTFVSAPG